MIRISPGDLLAISANSRFYYALVLSRIRLFGGNWCFAFHRTSESLLTAQEVLDGPQSGFNAFVDFIWAKREDRIVRLMPKVDVSAYLGPGFLKETNTHIGKADLWYVYDMELREIKRTPILTDSEKAYPLYNRIDDVLMVKQIDRRWTPESDLRI